MSTLEEKLKEIEARFQNTRPRTLSNAVEWYSAYADLEALIAMLRKRDEQLRREIVKHIKNPWQGVTAMEQYDAELLALAKGDQ